MSLNPLPIFPFPMNEARPLDLAGAPVDGNDLEAFEAFLAERRGDAPALVGGYGERRGIYAGSALFGTATERGEEPRVIHLGVDVWTDAGTPLRAPLASEVHSFAVNDTHGDYGGTVILEHEGPCWTLWGHLAHRSLEGLRPGLPVAAGEVFAWLGEPLENGGWPPHLHLQRINDLQGRSGDFPGVATTSEQDAWLRTCPDPSDLLR